MPRKSLAVRLAETKATLELWKAAGMEQDRSAQFMRDMIVRMERNRGLSTGQRKYVDSLIEQGAPQVHNKTSVRVSLQLWKSRGWRDIGSLWLISTTNPPRDGSSVRSSGDFSIICCRKQTVSERPDCRC